LGIERSNHIFALNIQTMRYLILLLFFTALSACSKNTVDPITQIGQPVKPKMIETAKFPCKVIQDGVDQQTGFYKKDIAYEKLFTYTPEKLVGYYKERDFLSCYSSVGILDETHYLYLKFIFDSKDASRAYGSIQKEQEIRISMIDGSQTQLITAVHVNAKPDPKTNRVIYDGIFKMNGSNRKKLKDSELDRIEIIWTSGFETYEIFNVDLLMNQLKCLEK